MRLRPNIILAIGNVLSVALFATIALEHWAIYTSWLAGHALDLELMKIDYMPTDHPLLAMQDSKDSVVSRMVLTERGLMMIAALQNKVRAGGSNGDLASKLQTVRLVMPLRGLP